MFSIDFCVLATRELLTCHFTYNCNDTLIHENNTSKFSECDRCREHKQELKTMLNTNHA